MLICNDHIKRLRGLKRPQYRLRVDDIRVYYDVIETNVEVLAIIGKPAGILIGFESEDEWFEYRLEHDPAFLQRIERARQSLRAGRGVRLEDIHL